MKFGGTSMGNSKAISKVADILMKSPGKKVAVVSATSGTTDELISLGKMANSNQIFDSTLLSLIEKHEKISRELEVETDLEFFRNELANLLRGVSLVGELSLSANDRIITMGERISSHILTALLIKRGLKSKMCDAFNFVFTDNNFGEAEVDFEKTNIAVRRDITPLLEEDIIPVITGFTGQSEDGRYTSLGRGGSDYTAAILGAALDCAEVQIWTDVDGISNADPRVIPEAKVLEQLSFNEAGELAYFGAKVLHPKTIKPAISKNIPVKILNTFNPDFPGTVITNEEVNSIKSVTAKRNITIVNICSAGMLNAHGFLERIFKVFADHKVVVDVVATSEVSVSVTIDEEPKEEVLTALSEFSNVTVYKDVAIVCLVGNGIQSNRNVLGELFSAVSGHEILMVSLGASKRNITFLVNANESPTVVKKVFNKFFNQ